HVAANLRTYPTWLAAVETPFVFVGVAALAARSKVIWPSRREQDALWLFLACVFGLFVMHALFTVFDLWMYLRFFLPIWPLVMIGTAATAAALYRVNRAW